MPAKNNIRSARKKFMVMRTKSQIFALLETDDSEVDEKLEVLFGGLAKVFGDKDATEILEASIEAADIQFSESVKEAIAGEMSEAMQDQKSVGK